MRRTRFDLRKAEERAHILEGLLVALDNIDEVIAIIRGSQTDKEASAKLMERFRTVRAQTAAILEMRLRRLTGLERHKLEDELNELREKIAYFTSGFLSDETLMRQVIKEGRAAGNQGQVQHPAPHAPCRRGERPRRGGSIAEEDMVVTVTKAGYVKRLPVATYVSRSAAAKACRV